MGFLYDDENIFCTELHNKYFTRKYFKEFFEWLSLAWQFASITS